MKINELEYNDIMTALYRRNNYNQPCIWFCKPDNVFPSQVVVYHGIVGKNIIEERFCTNRELLDECKSRINAKRKQGYKYLNEIRDNFDLPRREGLQEWLDKYLPYDRTNAEGKVLAMLAKTYDDKVFKKTTHYYGQWKINGLRCFIRVIKGNDIFHKFRLEFQSREGAIWTSLTNLEEYLLSIIDDETLDMMKEENIILDGEVYIPGFTVNEINHAVKDPNCFENTLVQFWCYDIAVEEWSAAERARWIEIHFYNHLYEFRSKESHLINKQRFVVLCNYNITSDDDAVMWRNKFIDMGFEGLILRNLESEYQFGKRNSAMIKYKKHTDGIFTILDIYPEGNKRKDLPLIKCKNDINDETFEVHIGGSFEYQSEILKNRELYIGRELEIEFGERSGVNQVPFHVKGVKLKEFNFENVSVPKDDNKELKKTNKLKFVFKK